MPYSLRHDPDLLWTFMVQFRGETLSVQDSLPELWCRWRDAQANIKAAPDIRVTSMFLVNPLGEVHYAWVSSKCLSKLPLQAG